MRKLFLAAVLAVLLPAAAVAGPYCYLEALAGGSVGANRLEAGGASVTLATDGYTAGIGAGCDYMHNNFVGGVFARASLARLDADLSLDSASYTVALRAGYMINPSTLLYGLAGITTHELQGLAGLDGKGVIVGLGAETNIGYGWRVGLEVSRSELGTFRQGGFELKPSELTGLVTVKRMFLFGE